VQEGNPKGWRAAHERLYEHYKASAPDLPDTVEEMAPLYAAVTHGCQAGRHQEAMDEVFWPRIRRGKEGFSWKKLGAFGADLAALSGFFDPPFHRLVVGPLENWKGFVLGDVGFDLRALGRLGEAAQPMQAALAAVIALEDWENAAAAAGNLSELYLTAGDLARALDLARQAVALADHSDVLEQRVNGRTTLADALHQAGQAGEAADAFREAEELQLYFPLLYSLRGFQYCDLLLNQERYEEALRRADRTLGWVTTENLLLSMALDHLSLGRAHLLLAQRPGAGESALKAAAAHLEQAVVGLRQVGHQEFIVRGLLARAALRRLTGELERARRDLDEALEIAQRGGMRLHEADCYLESARLYLAEGRREEAREALAQASQMVEEIGYRRRDGEVDLLMKDLEI
jgi:tetratricopeptide (TPR) repeat protein